MSRILATAPGDATRKLLVVEFGGKYPFHIECAQLQRAHYSSPYWSKCIWDVAYSERDKQLMFERSGFGGSFEEGYLEHDQHRYWLAPGVTLTTSHPRGRRLKRLPNGALRMILRGMDDEVEDIVYCTICNDAFDGGELEPCEHVYWCNYCGGWAGLGAADGYSDCRHRIIEPWDSDELDEDLEQTHL